MCLQPSCPQGEKSIREVNEPESAVGDGGGGSRNTFCPGRLGGQVGSLEGGVWGWVVPRAETQAPLMSEKKEKSDRKEDAGEPTR